MLLFPKLLTPGLTCKLDNPLDVWLETVQSISQWFIYSRVNMGDKNLVNKVLCQLLL